MALLSSEEFVEFKKRQAAAAAGLTVVEIRTKHPQDYELINHADGSHWVIRDGTWKRQAGSIS